MRRIGTFGVVLAGVVVAGSVAPGCGGETPPAAPASEVVLATTVDVAAVGPVVARFEETTGLHVIVRAAAAEAPADVVWTADVVDAAQLRDSGALAACDPAPAAAARIPDRFKDPDGVWFGLAGRAHVLIVNTDLVAEGARPTSMWNLVDPTSAAQAGFPRPVSGPALTHVTVLYTVIGKAQTDAFLSAVKDNGCHVVPTSADLARSVGAGEIAFGLVDWVDYRAAKGAGRPVVAVFPDQAEGLPGALLLPGAAALASGAPHPEAARRLLDFLLSEECAALLANGPAALIPLAPGVAHPADLPVPGDFREMFLDVDRVAHEVAGRREAMQRRFP